MYVLLDKKLDNLQNMKQEKTRRGIQRSLSGIIDIRHGLNELLYQNQIEEREEEVGEGEVGEEGEEGEEKDNESVSEDND